MTNRTADDTVVLLQKHGENAARPWGDCIAMRLGLRTRTFVQTAASSSISNFYYYTSGTVRGEGEGEMGKGEQEGGKKKRGRWEMGK